MKKIIPVLFTFILFSCGSSNSNNNTTTDSANAIEDHPIPEDTSISPFPNGTTPPNTKIDTSENKKDSIRALKHH